MPKSRKIQWINGMPSLKITANAPENRPEPKVSQPPFFRCYVNFRQGISSPKHILQRPRPPPKATYRCGILFPKNLKSQHSCSEEESGGKGVGWKYNKGSKVAGVCKIWSPRISWLSLKVNTSWSSKPCIHWYSRLPILRSRKHFPSSVGMNISKTLATLQKSRLLN